MEIDGSAEAREIDEIIRRALAEDIGPGDVTSSWTLPADLRLRGKIIVKAPGIVAGLEVARRVFAAVDPRVAFKNRVEDGSPISRGDVLATVHGPARSILSAERVALNFLQRMSGIATLTNRYVKAVQGTKAVILDTRKTAPGLRILDKMAVRLGGGENHRFGLYDMVLIKDNHIAAAGSITAAVEQVRAHNQAGLLVEVEVKNLDELREALELGVDRIMLDNMAPDQMRQAVAVTNGRVKLEASGGITLDNVAEIARTGVDYISVGALTHSAPALDISLEAEAEALGTLSDYETLSEEAILARIYEAKADLGDDLVILGHHYQRDEVIQFADYRGDSLELSRIAAQARDARYIVFCGVDFMAETAAMLCAPNQIVCLPAHSAVCPMAQMADVEQAEVAWQHLTSLWGGDLVPVTYQNTYATLKAFCGQKGGAVCTSANAQAILRWALKQKGHVLFFPDEHLGRNSALAIGIPASEIAVWDPANPEASREAARRATVVVWKGYCHVHTFFTVEHVEKVRQQYPGIHVIVHPECPAEVVARSDSSGSTSFIVRTVENAAPG
ncbi:MAG: quinolinate synthase NadA, partial [Chloroflexi bacterium]|nr:quinolinate synthase NadA [Chloroflexota bacterium]